MEDPDGGEGGVIHLDRPVFLPTNLDSYDGDHVTSPGRQGWHLKTHPKKPKKTHLKKPTKSGFFWIFFGFF